MRNRPGARGIILVLTLCAEILVPAISSAATCTGDVAANIQAITKAHQPIWSLYPASKKIWVDEMAKDLGSFYGANTQLFYLELLRLTPSFGPDYKAVSDVLSAGPIFGDAHFGNFGEYTDHGSTRYAINDVDDVTIAPRIYDMMRASVSLPIRFPDIAVDKLVNRFIAGYKEGSGSSSGFDDLADTSNTPGIIPPKKEDEPVPPAGAWQAAELALGAISGVSREDFDKRCKKLVYYPFHGGSSIGLPRFRVTCDGVAYEVKACLASAVDVALKNNRTCDGGKNIAGLSRKLFPAFVGAFTSTIAFGNIRDYSAFGFYGHLRTSTDLDMDDTDEDDVLKFVKLFGKAIAFGHQRASEKPIIWDDRFASQLSDVLKKTIPPMLQVIKRDLQTIPGCL